MNIQQERLDTCEVKLTVEVDPAQVDEANRRAARKLAQRHNIPGFRKGKAPYEIMLRHFGKEAVTESALQDLMDSVYPQAIDQAQLDPVGPGQMTEAKLDPPVFTFIVPLRPETVLGDYRSLRLGYTAAAVTEEALNEYLEHLREHESILEPVEREAQVNDVVTVDVAGKIILEPPATPSETVSAESQPEPAPESPTEEFLMDDKDVDVLLDPKLTWPAPGFGEKLIGIVTDENRHIELTFPADYANESLRGKLAHFEVKCKGLKSRTLPEWDDDLAKTLGYESMADMRVQAQTTLESQAKRKLDDDYTNSVIDIVAAGATVKYPPYLFDQEIKEMTADLDRRLREQNLTLEDYKKISGRTDEQIRAELEPSARERLRRSLVISKVIELEGLTVAEDDVTRRIEMMAGLFGKDADKYRQMMKAENARRSVRYDLLSDKAVQQLVAIAKGENPPAGASLEVLSEVNEPQVEAEPEVVAEATDEAKADGLTKVG